nr:unnamed protein product [Callosobruchus analis]
MKPSVCIPGPGCYCPGKDELWDQKVKKCVPATECSNGPGGVNAMHKKKGNFDIANVGQANGSHVVSDAGGVKVRTHLDFGGIFSLVHKICGRIKGGFQNAGSKISGLIHGGGGGKGKGGGKAGGKAGGGGGGEAGGGGGMSGGGGGGGGGNWSGSISIHGSAHSGIIGEYNNRVIGRPHLVFLIPEFIFLYLCRAVSIPLKIGKGIFTNVGKIGKMITTNGMKFGINLSSFDAKFVAGIVSHIEKALGFIVSGLADVQIGGAKGIHGVMVFIQKRVKGGVNFAFEAVIYILSNVSKAIHGGIKLSHIKQIGGRIAKLPVIRLFVKFFFFIRGKMMKISFDQMNDLGVFIDGIIEKHQDFFIPVFHKILNFFLAFVEAFHQVRDGGAKTGVSFSLGKFHMNLGPLDKGDWQICGLGDKTIGGTGKLI